MQPDPSNANRCLSAIRFNMTFFSGSYQVMNLNFTVAEFDTGINRVVGGKALGTAPFSVKCRTSTFPGRNLYEAPFNQCVVLDPSRYVGKEIKG